MALVPSQVSLTSGANTFTISQDSADANVHISSSAGNAIVYCSQPFSCSSASGIVASAGDVQSKDYSLETVGASVASCSSAITSLQSDVSKLQQQVGDLISVINTAFSLSLA